MSVVLLYITFTNANEAELICKALVNENLAACCNILSDAKSIYKWNDEVCEEQEIIAIIKTTQQRISHVENRIKELHSYDTPCLLRLEVSQQSDEHYLTWIKNTLKV